MTVILKKLFFLQETVHEISHKYKQYKSPASWIVFWVFICLFGNRFESLYKNRRSEAPFTHSSGGRVRFHESQSGQHHSKLSIRHTWTNQRTLLSTAEQNDWFKSVSDCILPSHAHSGSVALRSRYVSICPAWLRGVWFIMQMLFP